MDLGTRTRRYVGLLRLAVLVPLLCPAGLFHCGMPCRVTPFVDAVPEIASTCCHPAGPARDAAGGACRDHEGPSATGLKPGCCCPVDLHLVPGSLPRGVSELSPPCAAAADIAAPESQFPAEASVACAALSGYTRPGQGFQNTCLLIVNLRI